MSVEHGISKDIARLRRMLGECARAVVFTGAGISTESGIADFRSPGGIWTRYRPIDFQAFLKSPEARREAWRRKFVTDVELAAAEPNIGHRAIALLCRQGTASHVITQNVDGLHQRSGVPGDRVIELHGNATFARCLLCGARHEIAPIKARFETEGALPECLFCGGIVKVATISFGQKMPEAAMRAAQQATLACDLFLVIGSSLVVYPAAGFPVMAKENGARLVILNRQPTELDGIADIVINAEIGATLGPAVGCN